MKSHLRRTLPQVFLLCFVASVICLDIVSQQGYIGRSVLLPCNSTKSSPVNVFWRDEKENNVLDIIQGESDLKTQNEKYKGRVSSFPSQFLNKNYSIVLEKLEKNDTGNYKCSIVSGGVRVTTRVNLTVTEYVENSATCGASNVLQMFVLSALSLLLF
ncbi:CD276 antigen homolog isoform X2 [Fundulus heteroclitus]|uniref:CD276 antigen homolog isoform X2 n=1 Tax=Fundulus heteroclitus TaxID=8078 RepID=UPI00165BD001|nr:CD276 antigen homolog isoform X2 [Fundulus heteroclitus]